MSIFSKIGSALGSATTKVLDTLTVGIAHPIETISAAISKEKTVSQIVEKHFAQTTGKQVADILIGGAEIAGIVALGGAIGTASKAGTLGAAAKTLIPKTVIGKVAAATLAPSIATAVITHPFQAAEAGEKLFQGQAGFGIATSNLIAEPSLEKAKEVAKDYPVQTAIAAGLALAAIGGGIGLAANTVSTILNTKATKQNTTGGIPQAVEGAPTEAGKAQTIGDIPPETGGLVKDKTLSTDEGKPITAETTTVSTAKRRRYRTRITKQPAVRQNVQIRINNKAIGIRNERYLNERVYS